MPLRGEKLICSFSFKQHPASWDDFGVGRAKHFASLHFLALLFPQRHMHGSLAAIVFGQSGLMRNLTFVVTAFLTLSLITGRVMGQEPRLSKRQLKREGGNQNCIQTNKYSPNELRKFYPFNIANSVTIVSFENDTSGFSGNLPTVNGEIDYSKIKETKILTRGQIDSLASILHNVSYRGEIIFSAEASCYNPRNAVLFFDSNNHLLEFIEICFECHKLKVSSDKISLGDQCNQKSKMIKDFFFN